MKRAVSDSRALSDGARTLSDVVYRRLKADILWGRLAPGAALRSDNLRSAYNVGISPLREALTRLTAETLVISSGQRGFRVAPLTATQVRDTAMARILVESEALRRAIEQGNLEWETGIVAAQHALSRTLNTGEMRPEMESWSEQHRRFHFALLAGCQSEWLVQIASVLFDHAERHRIVAEKRRIEVQATGALFRRDRIAEHDEIAKFVLARNADGALNSLRRHYNVTADWVVAAMDAAGGREAKPPKRVQNVVAKRVKARA